MKRWRLAAFATVILAPALTFGQSSGQPSAQATTDAAGTLRFDKGVIANGIYSNECLGFSFPIPVGWEVNQGVTPNGGAKHLSGNSLSLLYLRQQQGNPAVGMIILNAWEATRPDESAEDYVRNAVAIQIRSHADDANRELTRDAFAVEYGGRHFVRSDYKTVLKSGAPLHLSYVYTKFRGYFVGETLASSSPEGLDQSANFLAGISFQEDQVNPRCVAGQGPTMDPTKLDASGLPQRVRVSHDVVAGLLVKKVPPAYPDNARIARVQGSVVLKALIDKDGAVEDLTLISGHPMLAPSAIEAVKQWKYKPYLLNGQPVKVETQIVVNFQLSGG
jgi:TonB family protein